MKTIKLYFALSFLVFTMNLANAQNPTFDLTIANIEISDSILGFVDHYDAITFDIMILHNNPGVSGPFEYALGQFYLNVKDIGPSEDYTYYIIPGSSEFSNPNAIPRNPTFVSPDPTSPFPFGASLRINSNEVLGAGSGPIVSDIFPGTRICTMRFKNKVGSFWGPYMTDFMLAGSGSYGSDNSSWRTFIPDPFTKISAYEGTLITDVSAGGMYTVQEDPFPVELAGFTSTVNRNLIILNWTTVSELNNTGFDIERSDVKGQKSGEWYKVGNVSGNGTTNSQMNYTYTDRANTGTYSYRLKQIDLNGNFEYFNLSNEVEVGVPESYALSQNYPNPFNPSTKINYDLQTDGKVSITLYDITGKQASVIVNEMKTAGYYTVSFNASNLSSGMYFYRMEAGNFVSVKKMLLIK